MGKSLGLLNNIKNKKVEHLNDDAHVEEGFSEETTNLDGEVVQQFTFKESNDENKSTVSNETTINSNAPATTKKKTPKGLTPPIDGESFDIKRSYQFRESTLRMLNELKNNHPDINVYLNTIVDAAIRNYYDYIIVQGNKQK